MKLQNLTVIFIIILLPIILIMSYYLNLQKETITLQNSYNAKLLEATKQAVEAFEINTVEWNNKYSALSDSKRRDILASINTFTTGMANSLGIGGENQDRILTYVPAITVTLYDGYYIYAPTEVAEVVTDADGVFVKDANGGVQYTGNNTYKHILKNFIPYSEQVGNFTINYTLDNYVRIFGKGLQNEVIELEGYLTCFSNTDVIPKLNGGSIKSLKYNGKDVKPETLKEYISYYTNENKTASEEKEYTYIYDRDNEKYYYDTSVGNFFRLSGGIRTYLPEAKHGEYDCKYKVAYLLHEGAIIPVYQVLNPGADRGQWYIYSEVLSDSFNTGDWTKWTGENGFVTNDLLYDFSAINYYVKSKALTDKVRELDIADYLNIPTVTSEDDRKTYDPGNETSAFAMHKREVMKNSIESNLNLAISSYSAHAGGYDYTLPKLTDSEWDQVFKNVTMITFFQGVPIGVKYYNNYAIVTSNYNKEYVSDTELYYMYSSDNEYYHRYGCTHTGGGTPKGYRSIEYSFTTDTQTKNVYYTHGDNNAPLKACYYCIVNRNEYDEATAFANKNRYYYEAVAREKYVNNLKVAYTESGTPQNLVATDTNRDFNYTVTHGFNEIAKVQTLEEAISKANEYYINNRLTTEQVTISLNKNNLSDGSQAEIPSTLKNLIINLRGNTLNRAGSEAISISSEANVTLSGGGKITNTETIFGIIGKLIIGDGITISCEEDIAIHLDGTLELYNAYIESKQETAIMGSLSSRIILGQRNSGEEPEIVPEIKGVNSGIITGGTVYFNEGWITGVGAPDDGIPYSMNPTLISDDFRIWIDNTRDENLHAYLTNKPTYTIGYNANGGTGAPSSQIKLQGTDNFTLRTETPTRTGYTFEGWATSNTAITAEYPAGGIYAEDRSVTMYAVWKPIDYTIIYNLDGGTISNEAKSTYTIATETFTIPQPTKEGYTFTGWTGTGLSVATKDVTIQKGSTGNRTYTANWQVANAQYKVLHYKMNTDGTTYTLDTTETNIGRVGTTVNPAVKTYTGFTSPSRQTATILADGSLEIKYYYTRNQYTLTFVEGTGIDWIQTWIGANSSNYLTTYTVYYGESVKTKNNVKTGYTWKNWTSSNTTLLANSTSQTYEFTMPAGNITLTANTNVVTYTISYDANGGNGAPDSQTKKHGENLTLSTTTPTRTGYNFLGWGTSSTATSATYEAGETYTANSSATLYAVWQLKTYTISYNANGGSGKPSSQTKKHGEDLTLSTTTPTRTGYNFLGWSTSSTATSATYEAGGTYTADSAATLYAVWQLKTYTISYNANGGSGKPSSQTKKHGEDLTLSTTTPTRTGYNFLGWSTSSTATSATYEAGGTYTADSAATLYAVWQRKTYTISYNANGGSGAPDSQTKTHGTDLTLSSKKPTRSGYTFLGWGTSSSATSASYQPGGKYTSNSGTTLYAVWQQVIAVTSVTLNKTTDQWIANNGSTLSLTATVSPTNATNKTVTWSSSNTTVATVSSGTVTAKGAGVTTITATAGGKSATVKVYVYNAVLNEGNTYYTRGSAGGDRTGAIQAGTGGAKMILYNNPGTNYYEIKAFTNGTYDFGTGNYFTIGTNSRQYFTSYGIW